MKTNAQGESFFYKPGGLLHAHQIRFVIRYAVTAECFDMR